MSKISLTKPPHTHLFKQRPDYDEHICRLSLQTYIQKRLEELDGNMDAMPKAKKTLHFHGGYPVTRQSIHIQHIDKIVDLDRIGVFDNSLPPDADRYNQLRWFVSELSVNLPQELLIFADDGHGGVFGIWLAGKDVGKVAYCCFERLRGDDEFNDLDGIYNISNSFEEFMWMLDDSEIIENGLE